MFGSSDFLNRLFLLEHALPKSFWKFQGDKRLFKETKVHYYNSLQVAKLVRLEDENFFLYGGFHFWGEVERAVIGP